MSRTMFGLVGKSLKHSFSKDYFQEKFKLLGLDAEYRLFEINQISEIQTIISYLPNLKGLNVTIPYKEEVFPYLEDTDIIAKKTGAVNTILIRDNKMYGFNTDYFGFTQSFRKFYTTTAIGCKALIIGFGGAAKTIGFALEVEFNSEVTYLNRKNNNLVSNIIEYSDLLNHNLSKYDIIINATPLGMFPNNNTFPDINYNELGSSHYVMDLIYNPLKTEFLKKAELKGAKILSGMEMLYLQADKSWEIWKEYM